jgi:hypothetical protein
MEKFKKIWPNKIKSSSGYIVIIEGRGSIIYKEEDKKIMVNSEYLSGEDVSIGAYSKSIDFWQSKNGKTTISEIERKRIIDNIINSCNFINVKVVFI